MKDLTDANFPLTITAYFGSGADVEQELSFASVSEYEGYLRGQNEADGWFEANFVENGAYYVNKDGDFAQRKGAKTDTSDRMRHVIWGEHPDTGTRADTYEFATAEEAAGFQRGVEDMVGWTSCHMVPSTDFKPFDDLSCAMSDPGMTADALVALKTCIEQEDLDAESGDLVFVRLSDGAFVWQDWDPRQPIINAPLSLAQWRDRFDAALKEGYGVGVEDAGLAEADLARLAAGPSARLPEGEATRFAEKHNLTPAPRRSALSM